MKPAIEHTERAAQELAQAIEQFAAALLRLQQLREEMMEQLGEWHEGVAS